jgi:hypothetical protein
MYGAFQVFGEPVGFDFYAEAGSKISEMGENVSLADSPVMHIKVLNFSGWIRALKNPNSG